jgi:aminopeptidase-like protein
MDAQRVECLFDRLFPLCRSIAGEGFRKSLEILHEVLPLEVQRVPSGTQVFDWTVPPEWIIRDARLTGEDGCQVASFRETNLAVVSYSIPVDRWLTLEELRPHLHSLPALPDATPYVTSYYRENWGFCLPHRVLESLPEQRYHAWVDSELIDGELNYGEAVLPGQSSREILLSSYLCHPSLANNELSGPLVLAMLYQKLRRWPRRRYTYRFLLNPETIGSLAFLSRRGEHLRQRLEAGLVLTCLGGPSPWLSFKKPRREGTVLEQVIDNLRSTGALGVAVREFTPLSGSDERQFCSPGFDLPVGQIARTVYGEYPGYHNSRDDKQFMGIAPLLRSAEEIELVLRGLECGGCFRNLSPHGEPQLGRRGLYPSINSEETRRNASSDDVLDGRQFLDAVLILLSYSDGRHSAAWIASRLGQPVTRLTSVIDRLEQEGLLVLEAPP